ncbi:MAG: iron-sulfur cluster-binding protein [Planctomycetes bacterium]|nr:iron-sulfur cluster-binding protein [Planctomycetota bacterium]
MSSRAFRQRVSAAIADLPVIQAVHEATVRKVEQRRDAMAELRNSEELRSLAAQIKQHTLDHLADHLRQFVAAVEAAGGVVHFAPSPADARAVICDIAARERCRLAVKGKSMTSEEIHLNDALAAIGIRTVETDLGEFIVQLDHDAPSHIVTPIIHKNRRQIAASMRRELGCEYTEDPTELTKIARRYLRDVFRRCDLGITGVNFGIAESGTLCICTNEGNGRMTTTRPRVHVALMGIEKLIPRLADLPVFLKLLARSSTGQPLTVYTTMITGPRRGSDRDGPQQLHVVLLDAERSALLGGPYAEVLRCIRCGACLNACPVYRNIGGHAYASVYPGPIGSLVTPLLHGRGAHSDLPRASSLCGACEAACPVRINIPELLIRLRNDTGEANSWSKRLGMRVWRWLMLSQNRYAWAQRMMRIAPAKRDGDGWTIAGRGPLAAWTGSRDLPPAPPKSFRDLWREGLRDE